MESNQRRRRGWGRLGLSGFVLLLLAAAAAQSVSAQSADDLRAQYRISPLRIATAPGTSLAIPGARGAEGLALFAGAAYQSRTRFTQNADGAVAAGFGLGNSGSGLPALEVTLTSFSTANSGFFERTHLSFKVHRTLADGWHGALGWESAAVLSGNGGDGGDSPFAVISRTLATRELDQMLSTVVLTAGVGSGRFRSEADIRADKDGVGLFGGVSVRVHPSLGVIADWTGQDLSAGFSVAPLPRAPLVISAGWADLTERAGDGARFFLSAGIGTALPTFF